ncbi:Clp1/GlmU family protein [[Eubacterium] cellulosolvens]
MRFLIQSGKTLLVSGPASFKLEEGEANVFGAPLRPQQKLIVKREKQFAIEIIKESTVEGEFGERATYLEIDDTTIPKSWLEAANKFQKSDNEKLLVIGSTDTGKSTLCTFLVNHILKFKQSVALIDADIGQSDLGPPGTLGLSIISKPYIESDNLNVDSMIFVGRTSPYSVTEKIINGILKLENSIQKGTSIVINTDGWILDAEAIAYKLRMIKQLETNMTIILDEGNELYDIFEINLPFMRIQVPKFIKTRGREERKKIREYHYKKYLRNAIHTNFSLNGMVIEGLLSKKIQGGEILGFIDPNGFLIGIGILEYINRKKQILRAYTNVNARNVTSIECGNIRLMYDGTEID